MYCTHRLKREREELELVRTAVELWPLAEKLVERIPSGRGVLEHEEGLVGLGAGDPVVVAGRRLDVVLAITLVAGLSYRSKKDHEATPCEKSSKNQDRAELES